MRIYYEDINIYDYPSELYEYFKNKLEYSIIYSKEGIYKIIENETYKLNIIDKEIENFELENFQFLIDKSIINLNKIERIPKDFFKIDYIEYKFKMHPESKLSLIITKNKNKNNNFPCEIYFEIKNSLNMGIELELLSLLRILKNIK